MKNGLASLFIIFILLFSTGLIYGESSISGRLIYIHSDYIEIKKGRAEYKLYWAEGSSVVKGETQMSKNDLYVCQIVRVNYTKKEGRLEITKVNIVRDSDCLK